MLVFSTFQGVLAWTAKVVSRVHVTGNAKVALIRTLWRIYLEKASLFGTFQCCNALRKVVILLSKSDEYGLSYLLKYLYCSDTNHCEAR